MTDLRKHLCDLFVSFSHAAVNHPAVLSQLQLSQCFFYSYLLPFAKVVPSLKSRIMQESTLLVFSNNKMPLQLKCSWLFVFEAYMEFLGWVSVKAATPESGMKNRDLDLMRDP